MVVDNAHSKKKIFYFLLKLTNVMTVTITLSVTRTIVKSKYLPINGITRLVDGIISTKLKILKKI